MARILEVEALRVFYGASQILFDVSLAVDAGQTLALLGRNGAGKSTTCKAIIGLVPPRAGRVIVKGRPVGGRAPYAIAGAGVGYVPEDRQIFPEHTVEDNLLIGAKRGPSGQDHWTLARIYEFFPILAGMKARLGGRLSGGEQQMLTIARTLMGNPEVLLLDEPSEGLAPVIVAQIRALVRDLAARGVTLLLAEQNMHFCRGVATHAAIIDKGQIVHRDTFAGFQADEAIKARYLAV